MTPEHWQRLQELFDEVMQASPEEREAVLRRVESTVEDPTLLEELRRLVKHSEPDPGFLRPLPGLLIGGTIQPGEVIGGRFEILRTIGRGGMGQVFEATDRKLDERVAIKIIAPEFACDPGLLERFLREVQIARRVSHPNICRIHDLGEHGGAPYLSMELLEGETLANRLEQGPLPLEEWESLARQLFDGLRAAHAVGVIHRDLKPSNLMLVGARVVILDFGLARPILTHGDSSLTRTGTLIGTLDWMAPEQLLGNFDERSDLYSAALILVQALKGKPTEKESGGLAAALRRATGDTDFRELLPASMTAAWRYVLLRCLERDPARRPAGAKDVQDILTQRRSRLFASVGSFTRNRSIRISAATVILLALLILGLRYLRRPAGLQPGSLIMVVQTINATGETDLVGVTPLLRADLEQSSQFNIWDNQRLGEAMRSMRLDPQSQPKAKEWHEIAVREKAPLLVFSTLSRLGDGYTLAISSEEIGSVPEPPVQHWEHSFSAKSRTGLFDAVHEAAQWIRSTAGENAADLSGKNRPPQDVTTSSWEALRLYDQAQSLSAAQRSTDAIPIFQRAVQVDPQFAMALMRLGDLLNADYKSEEGFSAWQKAIDFNHVQHLSEHEKLNIESRYAIEIKDFKRAEPILRDWTRKFSNDSLALQLLASCLSATGQYKEAIDRARDVQKRFGPTVFGTSVLIRSLGAKNQTADIEEQIKVLDDLSAHSLAMQFAGISAAVQGNYKKAEQVFGELISTTSGREASRTISLLANVKIDQGEIEEAHEILSAAVEKDREAGEEGLASQKTIMLAFIAGLQGNRTQSRMLALSAVSRQPSPPVIVESVTLLARGGYIEDANRIMQIFPKSEGPWSEVALLRMRGEILAAQHEYRRAADQLNLAVRTDQANQPREYFARALDLAGESDSAKAMYRQIADAPWLLFGASEADWFGPLLARQYVRKQKGE